MQLLNSLIDLADMRIQQGVDITTSSTGVVSKPK
ncbi:hypothetical protein P608_21255 [Comamonas thiooxydans]|uniref:Uncharacterized protein n=1 Tax=Comamonas thiooxydans TaxID=363952 RepID=A0A0E3BSM5_9BURK|nr:hypothetical protein P608_21255 [Comamonas thiooxydans]KGH15066.1 hypothetical protein P607_22265 [Comamonas thiooxydans]